MGTQPASLVTKQQSGSKESGRKVQLKDQTTGSFCPSGTRWTTQFAEKRSEVYCS